MSAICCFVDWGYASGFAASGRKTERTIIIWGYKSDILSCNLICAAQQPCQRHSLSHLWTRLGWPASRVCAVRVQIIIMEWCHPIRCAAGNSHWNITRCRTDAHTDICVKYISGIELRVSRVFPRNMFYLFWGGDNNGGRWKDAGACVPRCQGS